MRSLIAVVTFCACAGNTPATRWLAPNEIGPHGSAPGAKHRLLGEDAGAKHYVLVLATGDEVQTALHDFAVAEKVTDAHFVAIGGVKDPEAAWFDLAQGKYKAMTLAEQVEVLTLSGDIALGADGDPTIHAHAIFGRADGVAWGGHLIAATVSPTLEVFVDAYPAELHKQKQSNGLQFIAP